MCPHFYKFIVFPGRSGQMSLTIASQLLSLLEYLMILRTRYEHTLI